MEGMMHVRIALQRSMQLISKSVINVGSKSHQIGSLLPGGFV